MQTVYIYIPIRSIEFISPIISDGYTADQVIYKWSSGSRAALKLHKIRLPDFTIKEAYVTNQMEVYATGNYSRLYVCFVFSRSSGFCFLQLIIPSTAVDMISIILAITFLIFSYNEMMPRVSYIKAMDIYLGVTTLPFPLPKLTSLLSRTIRRKELMLFFFGFVIFCLFYFLVYPNLHIVSVDPSCDKTKAEWFADIV
ncbi:unnamed protein product [Nippostrongylus brasiliensis]|uniref:Uncharacterized protein n=1 Tax=Nippostrongylus brasiliensis TaxID=27835 RepID=A0A3P7AUH3_NIPBR|nr:unnamed protein product [Nippostrongylus brasiliensis]